MVLKAPLTGTLTSVFLFTGNQVPNQVVIATFPVGTTPASSGVSCGGNTCQLTSTGQTFTVQDVEGLSGLSTSTATTIGLALPVSVTLNQWVAVLFMLTGSTGNLIMNCGINCGSGGGSGINSVTQDITINFATTSPTIGNTYNTVGAELISSMVGGSFQQSASGGGGTTVTQCYGNCGNPAITLVNTNSTHTVNFNQSQTLFYLFQSNLNGFLVNVTTNLARSYSDGIHFVFLGIYTATCPIGITAFTFQCPGQEILGGSTITQAKGRAFLNAGNAYPVTNGMWVGLAFTGAFSGIDLNDTNTPVQVLVTNDRLPAIITQSSVFNSAYKMGLWAWITGNIITSAPPTLPGVGFCAQLDCILTALVNGFCSNLTPGCQTGSAIFWAFILTIIFETVLSAGLRLGFSDKTRLPFGEMFMVIFLGWLFLMSGLSLVVVFVPVFFITVVALLFSKHTGRYF